MSRTDVHRPWKIQESDPYERHRWRTIGDPGEFFSRWPLYNISRWSDRGWRRYGHKKERTAWRTTRDEILKVAAVDRDDIDPHIEFKECWY